MIGQPYMSTEFSLASTMDLTHTVITFILILLYARGKCDLYVFFEVVDSDHTPFSRTVYTRRKETGFSILALAIS